jgi:hypothetical protein
MKTYIFAYSYNWIRGRRGRVLFQQGNKSDKERKIVRKKLIFMHSKDGCNSV